MYFMMVTMTTTGYGDQYPSTTLGKIIAAFSAVFGILFLAMPLTIVGNAFYNMTTCNRSTFHNDWNI